MGCSCHSGGCAGGLIFDFICGFGCDSGLWLKWWFGVRWVVFFFFFFLAVGCGYCGSCWGNDGGGDCGRMKDFWGGYFLFYFNELFILFKLNS